jgi:hypothetical protein
MAVDFLLCDLFNLAVSMLGYVVLNGMMIDEL